MDAALILTATADQINAFTPDQRLQAIAILRQSLQQTQNAFEALTAERARPIEVRMAAPPAAVVRPKPPNPPVFEGDSDVERIRDWVKSLVRYCSFYALDLNDCRVHAGMYLGKSAAVWWETYCADQDAGRRPLFANIGEMLAPMCNEFAPKGYYRDIADEFHYLRQATSVKKYAYNFRRLMLLLPAITVEDQVARFIRGLKDDVKADLLTRNVTTLHDAENFAIIFDENHFKKKGQPQASPYKGKQAASYPPARNHSNSTPMDLDNVNATPLSSRKLPKLTKEERDRLVKIGACFRCRLTGHVSTNCPNYPSSSSSPTHQPSRRTANLNTVDASTSTAPLASENAKRQ